MLLFLALCLFGCSNTTYHNFTVGPVNPLSAFEPENLDLDNPKKKLVVNDLNLIYKKRYFSALGFPCLQYRSDNKSHHFCLVDDVWQEHTLVLVSLEGV